MGRVTVEVDDDLLKRAERLATSRNTTVPEMLERLLRIVAQQSDQAPDLPPITRSAMGFVSGVPDRPYKDLVADALAAKYGTDR